MGKKWTARWLNAWCPKCRRTIQYRASGWTSWKQIVCPQCQGACDVVSKGYDKLMGALETNAVIVTEVKNAGDKH